MTQFQSISRRRFFGLSAGILAASRMNRSDLFALGKDKKIPVALQLYSVRQESEKDFIKTIQAVAEIGYEGVEFAGYFDLSAKELRKVLDDCGLKVAGTHTGIDTVKGDMLKETIEYNQIIGNDNLIIPWLPENMRESKEAWLKTADMFNKLSVQVKAAGMKIGYHNHEMEFEPMDGEMPWDIFAGATDDAVILQLDTGNAGPKNVDPVMFLKKYPGRTVTVHIKEYSKTNKDAMIGEGDMPWKGIINACRTVAGTEWYIVEEEKDVYPPLKSVKISYNNFMKVLQTV